MSTFQVQLRKARYAAKLTQENLADELGVSKSQVSAWETGKEWPSIKHLPKLRALLGVSLDSLLVPNNELTVKDAYGVYSSGRRFTAADLTAIIESLPEPDLMLVLQVIARLRRL